MTVVGLVPARAGSKRIPRKNLLPFAGNPLVGHTCQVARSSGVLDALYVNTDCPEIARVATASGAVCPVLRPAGLASDEASTRDANLFLLHYLRERGEVYDAVMILQPTSPLRITEDVVHAWSLFEDHAPCSVVSVSPLAPESWSGRIRPDGSFERMSGPDTLFRLNGAIYIYRWDDYVEDRVPRKTVAYTMPATRGVDIDTREDLEYARYLAEAQHVSVMTR